MSEQGTKRSTFKALGLAWDLGYTIALPLVILALAGRLLDKKFNTQPWLLLLGVLLSIVITTWLVLKKTKEIIDEPNPASGGNKKENI